MNQSVLQWLFFQNDEPRGKYVLETINKNPISELHEERWPSS